MKRFNLQTLLVNDDDLECTKPTEEVTIDDINLGKVGFRISDIEKYDLIIYKGKLGQKIIRLRGI